jgi:hypothetical protein
MFIGSQALAQGGPNVTVVNTPLPVTVTNQSIPGKPLAFTLQVDQGAPASFPVPTNQRLVIEYVSGGCVTGSPPSPPQVGFATVTSGISNTHFIAIPISPSVAVNSYELGNLVKVYADPGQTSP